MEDQSRGTHTVPSDGCVRKNFLGVCLTDRASAAATSAFERYITFPSEAPARWMRLSCPSRPIRYEPRESSHDPLGGDGMHPNSPERLAEAGLIEAVGLGMGEQAPNERMN